MRSQTLIINQSIKSTIMVELLGCEFHIKPGKVLLRRDYYTKEELQEAWKMRTMGQWEVLDIAKNVVNFKSDFPVAIGDMVVLENSYHHRSIIDHENKLEYSIVNANQVLGCFKSKSNQP